MGKERERRWVEKKNGRTQTGEASKNLREFLVLAEPLGFFAGRRTAVPVHQLLNPLILVLCHLFMLYKCSSHCGVPETAVGDERQWLASQLGVMPLPHSSQVGEKNQAVGR